MTIIAQTFTSRDPIEVHITPTTEASRRHRTCASFTRGLRLAYLVALPMALANPALGAETPSRHMAATGAEAARNPVSDSNVDAEAKDAFEKEWAERAGNGTHASSARPSDARLVYLDAADSRQLHYHDNRLKITSSSLDDGWIEIQQCHRGLGPMPSGVIAFRDDRTRALKVVSSLDIETLEAREDRVVVRNAGSEAELCVALEMQLLEATAPGHWTLRNGPFQRRFLDGYYPMHVRIAVDWDGLDLRLTAASPEGADERTESNARGFTFEARFEGVLRTAFEIESTSSSLGHR
ncbi:MAG: hypothetical protein ACK4IT_03830 [Thioalkalivibrionaceae bacterium]